MLGLVHFKMLSFWCVKFLSYGVKHKIVPEKCNQNKIKVMLKSKYKRRYFLVLGCHKIILLSPSGCWKASSQIGLVDLMNLKLSILTSFCPLFFYSHTWSFPTWCKGTFYCQFHRISWCQLDSWSCLVISAWFLCS